MSEAYSSTELAGMGLPGMPRSAPGWRAIAAREGWPITIVAGTRGRGGKTYKYVVPRQIAAAIEKRVAEAKAAERIDEQGAALRTLAAEIAAARAVEEDRRREIGAQGEGALRALAGLSEKEKESMLAHAAVAEAWRIWFAMLRPPIARSASWIPFADAYNAGEIPVEARVRQEIPRASGRSVQRWVLTFEAGNLGALVDRRSTAKQRPTVFDAQPLLAAAATRLLLERPGIRVGQLVHALQAAARAGGGEAMPAPSYAQVHRWHKAWVAKNAEFYQQQTNPDAWKSHCMLAFGSRSEDVSALNGRWEMDSTPADWMLVDEQGKKRRFTVSVVVDVYSRRMAVVVSKTPKTVTHCLALRHALLAWGVPAEIVTDNGADYVSMHFRAVVAALGVTLITTDPFSPEQKPHVERAIGTLNHSVLELLPSCIGHSVADRQAIRARESFAARLARRGEMVDFSEVGDAITGERLQQKINQWIAGIYECRAHRSLGGKSPRERAASWDGEVRRISDERALDVLLARPAGGGKRTLQKKGIALDGTWFIAAELATIDVGSEVELYETADIGRVVVYHKGKFLCIAEAPERTGVCRADIATKASAMQRERLRERRKEIQDLTRKAPSTDEVLRAMLEDSARASETVRVVPFGRAHTSDGLQEAAKAAAAMDVRAPSGRAAQLSASARQAMAEGPAATNVVQHPLSRAHATPLEGMSGEDKYRLWLDYDAAVRDNGGDPCCLPESWQRRFWTGFPESTVYRAQSVLAREKKEVCGGG